jgi:methylthioribose-1-phosphate isomerase
MLPFKTIEWKHDHAVLIDQTLLPYEETYLKIVSIEGMAEAIKKLRIRGAPAIGIAAAYGLVIGAKRIRSKNIESFIMELHQAANFLKATRPTAVNLFWAVDRLLHSALTDKKNSIEDIVFLLEKEALAIHNEDIELCKKIGQHGVSLFEQKKVNILTHCNAGALATGGQGTALSIIYELKKNGYAVSVYADETRPLLQGTRLTSWELKKADISVTLICDTMAATVMKQNKIDCVIVGADRIAANGDVANKIGTFPVALAASEFNIPFYVAAPYSTFDHSLKSGDEIPVEERSPDEVVKIGSQSLAPEGISVFNPAFDITPNKFINAIITDKGVLKKPFFEKIKNLEINLDKA